MIFCYQFLVSVWGVTRWPLCKIKKKIEIEMLKLTEKLKGTEVFEHLTKRNAELARQSDGFEG